MSKCPVCGSEDKSHDEHDEHGFFVASQPGMPLTLVISMQSCYDNSFFKARALSKARAEIRKYFPGKEFDILPSREMLRKDMENTVIIGEAHTVDFIALEK